MIRRTTKTSAGKITFICLLLGIVTIAGLTDPAYPGEGKNGVRTIYLIRHGHYDHEDQRDPDVGKALFPIGIAQARLVAARLKSIPGTKTSLHSSTMTRARQTALVIGEDFPELELQQTRILRECTPPTWREDVMAQLEEGDGDVCKEQIEKAFAKFFVPSPDGDDRNDILVCHGNVIRYFVTKVLGVDTLAWLGMSIGNCSLTAVRIRPDGSMRLQYYGDVGHIPPNLQTRTGQKDERLLTIPGQ